MVTASGESLRPNEEQLWQWLSEVPDPEIPVISVVDLGIVRATRWDGDTLVIVVTPTYSGCPATRVINDDITAHMLKRGVSSVRVERQLSPAWTTAWLSEAGREKLQKYGIAPPDESVGAGKRQVVCPHCKSCNTELISQFGSTPCKAAHRCKECLEPFDYFKCI